MTNRSGDFVPPSDDSGEPEAHPYPEPVDESRQFGLAGYGQLAPIPIVGIPQPVPPEPGEGRRDVIAAILVAIVVAAAGLGVGLLWFEVAPRVEVIKVAEGFLYADSEPEQPVAADGWFGFLGLGVGLIVALVAWVALRRYRGIAVMVGLVVGSLAGAWLAWWLAVRMGISEFDAARAAAPIGARLDAPLALRLTDLDRRALWPPKITGVVAAQALMAAVTYTTLAGFSSHTNLRRQKRTAPEQLSSGSAVPAGPRG